MKILLLAGEESGVLYANQIRAEILHRCPDAEIRGYGDYGFKVEDLAVMGIEQVLRKLFYFIGVKRTMERAIVDWRPDVVCTIDYPGMNLKLAAYAKARGFRTVHVVCPQVWAWRRGRIPKVEAALDSLCCFFPFEPALFKPGFAEFVGHPLVEAMQAERPASAPEHGAGKLLAVLPGSRIGEIEKHLPILLEAVRMLRESLRTAGFAEELKVVIPAANARAKAKIESLISRYAPIDVQQGGARELLRRADAAVVASGTATLEAALAGCPTVLVYKVGWLFAAVARRVIKGVKHLGLANVIAEKAGAECPMPEYLQENLKAESVYGHLYEWLTDAAANAAVRQKLAATVALLKAGENAIARIAERVIERPKHKTQAEWRST